MPGKEINAPGKGRPIQHKEGADLSGIGSREEFLRHSAPVVCIQSVDQVFKTTRETAPLEETSGQRGR